MNRPEITNPEIRICKNCKHYEEQEMFSGKCKCINMRTLNARIMSADQNAWLRVFQDFTCLYFDTDYIFGAEGKPVAKIF